MKSENWKVGIYVVPVTLVPASLLEADNLGQYENQFAAVKVLDATTEQVRAEVTLHELLECAYDQSFGPDAHNGGSEEIIRWAAKSIIELYADNRGRFEALMAPFTRDLP